MASMVRNFIVGLSAREKKMAGAMIGTALIMIIFLGAFFVNLAIGELEIKNAELAQLLTYVKIKEPQYKDYLFQKKKNENIGKPKPLRTLVDSVVQKIADLEEPDTKELSDQKHGDLWLVRSVEVNLRRIGLENLVKFMELVEANRRFFPIAISKLEIKKRKRDENQFDVKMTISTYERTSVAPANAADGIGAGNNIGGGH